MNSIELAQTAFQYNGECFFTINLEPEWVTMIATYGHLGYTKVKEVVFSELRFLHVRRQGRLEQIDYELQYRLTCIMIDPTFLPLLMLKQTAQED
jgi:hypothetical protein